ncbi:unnamed protein product [Lota lota]
MPEPAVRPSAHYSHRSEQRPLSTVHRCHLPTGTGAAASLSLPSGSAAVLGPTPGSGAPGSSQLPPGKLLIN